MDPYERELWIRTVYGEAGNEPVLGQAGVAHVIRNRLLSGDYGKSIPDVVLAPSQFEPWNTREGRIRMAGLKRDDPAYQRIANLVDAIDAGKIDDPTGGALNFANATTVASRGDPAGRPGGWLDKMVQQPTTVQLGAQVFGNPRKVAAAEPVAAAALPVFDPAKYEALAGATRASDPEPALPTFDPKKYEAVKYGTFSDRFAGEGGGERPSIRDQLAAYAARGQPTKARSALLGAARGVTGEFIDEIASGLNAGVDVLTGQAPEGIGAAYDARLASARRQLAEAEAANPKTTLAGQVAGGVVQAPLVASGLGAIPRVGAALAASPTATGLAQGALAGVGEGQDATSRTQGMLIGGALGGALGATVGPAVSAIGSGARGLWNAATAPVREAIVPAAVAERQVVDALSRDALRGVAMPAAEVAAGHAAGQPIVLGDVGGRAVQRLARTSTNLSDEAAGTLDPLVQSRFAGQTGRTADFVRDLVGGPANATVTREALENAAEAANRGSYGRAWAASARRHPGGVWTPELETFAQAPEVQTAMRDAVRRSSNVAVTQGGAPVRNPFVNDAAGNLTLADPNVRPTLEFWHAVGRSLRSSYGVLERAGNPSEAREIGNLRRAFLGHIDAIAPEYAAARGGAARAFGEEDALEAGQRFVMSNMDNTEARRALARMSQPERELFQEGFASSLIDKISKTGDSSNITRNIFQNPHARERVEIALGPGRTNALEAFMHRENLMNHLRTAVVGGSSTARQAADIAGKVGGIVAAPIFGGAVGAIAGDKDRTTSGAVGTVLGLLASQGRVALSRRVATQVGNMLASDDPATIRRLTQMAARSPSIRNAIRLVEQEIVGGAVAGTEGLTEPDFTVSPSRPERSAR